MGKKDKGEKTTIDDWMIRITYAEAGEPDMGFKATGLDIVRKTKLALDKIMVARSEKIASMQEEVAGDRGLEKEMYKEKEHSGEKLNVMVLDDEPIVGKRLKSDLTKHGFEVEVYEDSTRALARLNEKEFDIVVTDFRMEDVDGIQILEHIMANSKNTRVILITGYATVEVAKEALVKGAFDFIAKPFKPKDVRAVINKAALSLGHEVIM